MKSTFEVTVEFGDSDPAQIVFYPHFFRWFDCSAWRLFEEAGLSLDVLRDDFGLIGMPIAEARSRFIRPARYRDQLEVTSFVSSWRRKTFDVSHEIRRDGELLAEGMEIRVCAQRTDDGAMRAIIIPDEIRKRLSASG